MKLIFDFLMISGVLLGIIFIIATQYSKNRKDKTIIYLDFVIAFLLLNNLQAFSLETVLTDVPFFIRRLQIPWYVLILPSFYTFLTYYLKIENKIQSFVILSLFVFIFEMVIRVAFFPYYFKEDNSSFIGRYVQMEEIINAAFSIYLFVKSIMILFKYSDLYEQILTFDDLKWLKNFIFLGGIVILMWICAILLNLDNSTNPEVYVYYPLRLSSTALLYWISYQGFYNYSLMSERIELRKIMTSEESAKHESLSHNDLGDDKFQIIKIYIEKNKRYRDPSFSLEKLASETDSSISKLSHLINQGSGQNFPDFINSMRVDKAKKYLTKPTYSAYTIVAIGLECGFNSKSAFYAAFKKFTSVTPSEFRENTKNIMS